MQKIAVIQTAFIGDVVLSTSLLESLHSYYSSAQIDVIVRKGNEALFLHHPFVNNVIVWDKQRKKYANWWLVLKQIRAQKYDLLLNVQRYTATGLWTVLSNAITTIGFDKNPLSFMFTHRIKHQALKPGLHEIQKNHALVKAINSNIPLSNPKLYPATAHFQKIKPLQIEPYICIAPASVWYTKQFPIAQWVKFLNALEFNGSVYIIGGPGDKKLGDQIIEAVSPKAIVKNKLSNVAGQLHFLSSAALQKSAILNYVNDSAPMHFASAMNAPVVAIYCSTIPDFGYGPLSTKSYIVQTNELLTCKPCGLHGKNACPMQHFECAMTIQIQQLLAPLVQMQQH